MDISYCRELITLADELNFSKAAERLYITQSTLSKHVAAVEREIGFRVFDRTTSRVELTAGGELWIDGLRDVVEKYDTAVREGRSRQHDSEATVRVVGPLINEHMLSLATMAQARLCARGMDVRLVMADTGVRDCHERLLDRRADIALAFRYEDDVAGLCYRHLFDVPFGIACHSAHPLAEKSPLLFRDMVNEHLLTYPEEEREAYHEFVLRVCRRHGIAARLEHLEAGAMCFPSSEDGLVFGVHFPGYARYGGDIVDRPLDDRSDVFDVCVVRREDEENESVLQLFDGIVLMSEESEADGPLVV